MNIDNYTTIVVKYIINEIADDGFDGWDYGSDVDRFAIFSIGLNFNF